MVRQANWEMDLIFDKSVEERTGHIVDNITEKEQKIIDNLKNKLPKKLLRAEKIRLPRLSELEVVRHYIRLSQQNFSIDSGFYPLGSCTMKYNPKICDVLSNHTGASNIHPYQDASSIQGSLKIMYNLSKWLEDVSGMDRVTLQPAAGAHGEYTGMMILRAYLEKNNKFPEKNEIIVPDSAHGTNPATASMCGFKIVVVPSDEGCGCVDVDALEAAISEKTAGLMLTNPNTLGIFETNIDKITSLIHGVGGLAYYDGANFNAIMGKARPGDMGFDIMHFNLHKTFATPHGGGGPGSGPVGVKDDLVNFLPVPLPEYNQESGNYYLSYEIPNSIGKVRSFYGNFSQLVRAYVYILRMGGIGLTKSSELAVLNSNYMKVKLEKIKGFSVPYSATRFRMHEFVLSTKQLKNDTGISALDVSKFLLDRKIHPPTIYFPLIVPEALMIEPTESESKRRLDEFIEVIQEVSDLAYSGKTDTILKCPTTTTVRRIDDVKAARDPKVSYKMI